MKNNLILLLISVCFSSSILQAQELSQTYLYDEFKDGLVLFKDGRRSSAMLNYNTTVEEMLYKNGEQIWAIANPLEIAAIDIQGDMFVYIKMKRRIRGKCGFLCLFFLLNDKFGTRFIKNGNIFVLNT